MTGKCAINIPELDATKTTAKTMVSNVIIRIKNDPLYTLIKSLFLTVFTEYAEYRPEDENFAQAINDQAKLMAEISPDELWESITG